MVIGPTSVLGNLKKVIGTGRIPIKSYGIKFSIGVHAKIEYRSYAYAADKADWNDPKFKNYLVIFDESHNLNNPKLKMYKRMRDSRFENVHKILMMTATPISDSYDDLHVSAEILNKKTYRGNITLKHIVPLFKRKVSVWEKSQGDPSFPTRVGRNSPTWINISPKTAQNLFLTRPNVKTSRKFISNRNVSNSKFKKVLEKIQSHKKVIVYFDQVSHEIPKFKRFLEAHGIGYSQITGDTQKRENVKENFVVNPLKKVMIISKAGEAGVNFRNVTQVHFMNIPYSHTTNMQVIGRANRRGNTSKGAFEVFRWGYNNPHSTAVPSTLSHEYKKNTMTFKSPDRLAYTKLLSSKVIFRNTIDALRVASIENYASNSPNKSINITPPKKKKTPPLKTLPKKPRKTPIRRQ